MKDGAHFLFQKLPRGMREAGSEPSGDGWRLPRLWALPILAALALVCVLLWDVCTPVRTFSAAENRRLAQRPALSLQAVLDGSFMEQYEAYVTDQMPGRDLFIAVKAEAQRLLGKKDINGVYFVPGGLVERHTPESVDREKAARKAERMLEQAEEISGLIPGKTGVMLVPAADAVRPEVLPRFSRNFDQEGWLSDVQEAARTRGLTVIDALGALREHAAEEIYYTTDHHWTTLGAFYGYQAMCEAFGLEAADPEAYERHAVSGDFYGTLQAKVNIPMEADRIEIFTRAQEAEHPVRFVYEEKEAASCYFPDRLATRDAYAFFLDGNYPLVEIAGDGPADRSILLIKDSYANCFAPFLTRDYGTIWLLDRRYYRGDTAELVREYAPTDVLYLYQVFQFIENF